MATRYRWKQELGRDSELSDIRELMLMLVTGLLIAGPDVSGELTQVRAAFERFCEQRREAWDAPD